jgi:hypothetical protein
MLHSWRKQKDVLRQIPTDMVIRRVGIFRIMVDRTVWPQKPIGLEVRGPMPEKFTDETDEEYEARLEDWEGRRSRGGSGRVRTPAQEPIVMQRRDPRVCRWRGAEDGSLLIVVEHYETSKTSRRCTASRAMPTRPGRCATWRLTRWCGSTTSGSAASGA